MAEEVHGADDGPVLGEHPRGPSIDVSDPDALERRPAEGVADLRDVVYDCLGVGADAGVVGDALRGAAVEVFGSHGDADDALSELVGPEAGGLSKGDDFVVDGALAGGAPDAEEKVGLRVEGRFDGLCWLLER